MEGGRAGTGLSRACVLLAALASTWVGCTQAGRAAETPFFRYFPGPLRHAFALEMLAAHIESAALPIEQRPGDASEAGPGGRALSQAVEAYLPLFQGSLASQMPGLAASLQRALDEAVAAGEQGRGEAAAEAARQVLQLLDEARELLVPRELREEPAFVAALMAMLLLSDDGVAVAAEPGASGEGDPTAVAAGSLLLRRVEFWWQSIRPDLPERAQETDEALGELDALLSQAATGRPVDADAVEEAATRAVGELERLTSASLFPDRDLASVAALGVSLVSESCRALETEADPLAAERLAAVRWIYGAYLKAPAEVLAPELHDTIAELLDGLFAGAEPAGCCRELLAALQELAECL